MSIRYPTLRSLCFLMLITSGQRLLAQRELVLGLYSELRPYSNPASIASTDALHLRASFRDQRLGVDSVAQRAWLVMADMPIELLGLRQGLGLQYEDARLGEFRSKEATLRYALSLSLAGGRLQLGAGIHIMDVSYTGSTGLALERSEGRGTDASVGLYYQHPNYWIGLSSGQLLQGKVSFAQDIVYRSSRSYVLMGGYRYRAGLSPWLWEPSVYAQIDEGRSYRLEGRLGLWYQELVWATVMYRHRSAIGLSAGLRLGQVYVAYQYEHPTSDRRSPSRSAHEVMVGYTLPVKLGNGKTAKYKSIRLL